MTHGIEVGTPWSVQPCLIDEVLRNLEGVGLAHNQRYIKSAPEAAPNGPEQIKRNVTNYAKPLI
ncbi:hypothetical protein D9M70_362550 [compost metagenome]